MTDFRDDLTSVPGFRVGSAEDLDAATGCTVVLCPEDGAVGGVDQRGGAPGTRETDPLGPLHLVQRCHAVVLTGGSAFGLDAAGGVVAYLEERGIGFATRAARVPIVPAAVLYDLGIGRADRRPDPAMGRAACLEAELGGKVRQGNAGAGAGATVGKVNGLEGAMKGGLGSAALEVLPGIWVGALVAVNAFGDVLDSATGGILAGARLPGAAPHDPAWADTVAVLRQRGGRPLGFGSTPGIEPPPAEGSNTVIGVVATNARLDKEGANLLARMANAGLARSVRPVHTLVDGDTIFALAAGEAECDVNLLGAVAADLVARAVMNGIMRARTLLGVPCAHDLRGPVRGLRIRETTPETLEADIDAVREVGRTILTWFRISSVEEMIPAEMRYRRTLIAEVEGKAVGFILHGPSDLHPEEGLTEIHWLAVDAAYRGRGVGHALVRVLEEMVARTGGVIELWTVPDAEYFPPYDSTRAFYRAVGFEPFYIDAPARAELGIEKLYFRKRVARAD